MQNFSNNNFEFNKTIKYYFKYMLKFNLQLKLKIVILLFLLNYVSKQASPELNDSVPFLYTSTTDNNLKLTIIY